YVVRMGAKYDLGVVPVLSHYTRHYMRLYLKVRRGVNAANRSLQDMGFLYYCSECSVYSYLREEFPSKTLCSCGSRLKAAGPLWLGSLHDRRILSDMLSMAEQENEKKLLTTLLDELSQPFFYDVHRVASDLGVSSPKIEIVLEQLRNQGFAASRTHFTPVGVKTDASLKDVKKALS
ncbi:MAG: tRNA (guanine(10)-N(2))-dimethyltransferase, partial [Candidatus Hydrothermarchaeales archaeon]